jgi:surfactin synthase thioesterase subunit
VNSAGWLVGSATVDAPPRIALLCFPFAGGGPSMFSDWRARLAPDIGVYPVQLPGRERRLGEPPVRHLPPIVSAIVQATITQLDDTLPIALFGYSLGALVAFEVAHAMHETGRPVLHLFVACSPAPHVPRRPNEPTVHDAPRGAFIDALRCYGGTPEDVLQSVELMQLAEPVLRADFALRETYAYRAREPLTTPITAIGGTRDPRVPVADVDAWRLHTTDAFDLRLFDGDHFLLHQETAGLHEIIVAALRAPVRSAER